MTPSESRVPTSLRSTALSLNYQACCATRRGAVRCGRPATHDLKKNSGGKECYRTTTNCWMEHSRMANLTEIPQGSRVYIAGAAGMLGDAVYATVAQEYEVLASDIVQ